MEDRKARRTGLIAVNSGHCIPRRLRLLLVARSFHAADTNTDDATDNDLTANAKGFDNKHIKSPEILYRCRAVIGNHAVARRSIIVITFIL